MFHYRKNNLLCTPQYLLCVHWKYYSSLKTNNATTISLSICKIDLKSLGNMAFSPLSASLILIIFSSMIRGCSSLFLCPKILHGNNNNLLCGIQCSLCVPWKYYFLLKDKLCKHILLNYHKNRQRLEWLKKPSPEKTRTKQSKKSLTTRKCSSHKF